MRRVELGWNRHVSTLFASCYSCRRLPRRHQNCRDNCRHENSWPPLHRDREICPRCQRKSFLLSRSKKNVSRRTGSGWPSPGKRLVNQEWVGSIRRSGEPFDVRLGPEPNGIFSQCLSSRRFIGDGNGPTPWQVGWVSLSRGLDDNLVKLLGIWTMSWTIRSLGLFGCKLHGVGCNLPCQLAYFRAHAVWLGGRIHSTHNRQ